MRPLLKTLIMRVKQGKRHGLKEQTLRKTSAVEKMMGEDMQKGKSEGDG